MKTVLFSPVGGTDPISNYRDGSILHICRKYKPDCVMLYLSAEMLEYQRLDDRYRRTLQMLAEEVGFQLEILEEERPDLTNPQRFDEFYNDFERCLHKLQKLYPKHRLLVNLSSGTPAMKSELAVLTLLVGLRVQGIQVDTPVHRHNGQREELKAYDVDLFWECNEDRDPNKYEDRCIEMKQENLRGKLLREVLEAHLKAYDYPAASKVADKMDALLPEAARQLLSAAVQRIQGEWREIPQPVQAQLIAKAPGEEVDIFEHLLVLQIRQRRGELAEFLRGLTPVFYRLSVVALRKQTKKMKFDLESACDQQGRLQQSKLPPDIQSRLDRLYGKTFEAKYPNSDMCCKLLADMAPASPCVQELNVLRDIEFHLRNVAAHTIEPITEERIRKECRQNLRGSLLSNVEWSSSEIFKLLKQCAQSILSSSELRWNSYDLMNERILRAMRLDDQ